MTTMVEAINAALRDSLADDEKVLVFGQDVGRLGGVFRVTDGLQDRFGPNRCFDTPLAESAIVGTAIGLAMRGFRPVPEIQFDGFSYPAFEQIISHLAKLRNRTRGAITLPITLRIPSHGGVGAIEHHSESPETYFVHTAGLKVVTPATPADAYSLLRESISSDDPIVFLEPKRRYYSTIDLELPVTTEPIGRAVIRRSGTDATLVGYGPSTGIALDAADAAADEGISLEVIDLRSLVPLDIHTVVESVRRTGRCVIVHEAARTLGMGAELAALVQEHAFYDLEAPVLRATGFDTPNPPPRLEHHWLPDIDRVLDCVEQTMAHR
ncbi:MAG: alpha-ketoacid dehydrogenase subunit beta [Acidimicrobiia bacterium]|nr:alpha-ketoacid dehydrogenase subunit beta [Acidimicrobiia bacterium]